MGWRFQPAAIALPLLLLLPTGCAASPPGCRATQVHTGPIGRQDVALAPWVLASPESAGIFVYLMDGSETLKAGVEQELLIIVDHPGRAPQLEVFAVNETNKIDYIRATLPRDLAGTDYRMRVTLPSPGCWTFDLKSGATAASLSLTVRR